MLPIRKRHAPTWFKASEDLLHAIIHRRNLAFNLAHSSPYTDARSKYNNARRVAKQAVRKAKSTWIKDKCDSINFGFDSGTCGKNAWDTVKLLKAGLAPARRPPPTRIRREDGSITTNSAEGAEVFEKHFH